MGAWAGALWAAAKPQRVARALWLAPGFHLADRWPTMVGRTAYARWEREEALEMPDGAGELQPVHFELLREAASLDPAPAPAAPTRIVHGREDVIVPIEGSRAYVAQHAEHHAIELIEVDDDHRLTESIETIWSTAQAHFEL